MTLDRKFFYVNAPAGSGKTYQAERFAINSAQSNNQKTVIVFKSKGLMAQARRDANAFMRAMPSKVPLTCFNNDHLGADVFGRPNRSVIGAILAHLTNANPNTGEVLFISEAAFLLLPHWPKRWAWHCICDEIPIVSSCQPMNIPENHKMLTRHLNLATGTPLHSIVTATEAGRSVIQNYADNKQRDDISAYFSTTAKQIINPDYDVYTTDASYQRVVDGDSLNGYFQLQFFWVLKPSIFGSGELREGVDDDWSADPLTDEFASVTIMGASFTDSLMHYIWPDMGVSFIPHKIISKGLRYHQHSCGDRLQIRYLFKEPWSKRRRDHMQSVGDAVISNLDIMLAAIKEEFGNKEFVYLVNKDKEDEVRDQLAGQNGVQLPNSPYGLNEFQHIHQAAILSALNTTPAHYKFLEQLGVDGDAVRESMYHQASYQAIMRTSLRDKNSTEPVKVIVADLGSAQALQEQFPGAKVSGVITGITEQPARRNGRPPKEIKKSKAEVQRETRARSRHIRQIILDLQQGKTIDGLEVNQFKQQCRTDNKDMVQLKVLIDSSYSCTSNQANNLSIPIFKSIHSSKADANLNVDINAYEDFIDQLQIASCCKVTGKHTNVLLSTTAFDASLSDQTNRGLDNITHIWGVWLDIDGGVMPKDHIPKLFPYLRMAVFNSWSAGNYRIFIPTTQFMSIGTHDQVIKGIVAEVEQSSPDWEITKATKENRNPKCYVSSRQAEKQKKKGYASNPIHGIDLSKLTPSSMFYLPAQCGDDPSKSFFIDHNDPDRNPLEPNLWIKHEKLDVDELEQEFQHLKAELGLQDNGGETGSNTCDQDAETNTSYFTKTSEEIIESAIAEYRSVPDGEGRHKAFFTAMRKIHYFGKIPLNDLHLYMSRCDYDGHQCPNYKSILQSLSSGKYAPKRTGLNPHTGLSGT